MIYSIFERLMQETGETPYQVAKATGVSQSTLSDWKTGKSTPRNPNLKKLADHFGVTVAYLRGEADEPGTKKEPAAMVGDGLSEDELELIRYYRKLSPDRKEDSRIQLRALADKK